MREALCFWFWLSTAALAAPIQESAQLRTEVDRSEIQLGDRFHLTVSVSHAQAGRVEWPPLEGELGSFEVMGSQCQQRPAQGKSRLESTCTFELTAFALGEQEIPPIEVVWVPQEGDPQSLLTDPLKMEVQGVVTEEEPELREIKPPMELPRDWRWPALIGLGIALLAGLSYWAWRRLRSRSKATGAPSSVPFRPAHEVALEALDDLERQGLLEKGEIKEFHTQASGIIRLYLEGRFRIIAMELTSAEILEGLRKAGLQHRDSELFRRFFSQCDLVKFAKLAPPPDTNRELIPKARELVQSTMERAPINEPAPARKQEEAGPGPQPAAPRASTGA